MNEKIKVMVVDDSMVVRRILQRIIESDPQLVVVDTARNGREALDKVEACSPDVMTLDIEMPELDGIGTLRELKKRAVRLPIVMFSTLTERGGRKTLEALSLGATDYVTKPESVRGADDAAERIKQVLLPKLKALGARQHNRQRSVQARRPVAPVGGLTGTSSWTRIESIPPALPAAERPPAGRVDAVMLGISTGGPTALQELMASLRLDVPMAIVQHMPPTFTRLLADRLNALSPMEVLEATPGMPMRPGRALVAPGDWHLAFERRGADVVAKLHQGAQENSCRPAVDVMLRSGLEVYGPNVLTVIMTGMGHDGALGASAFHARGARVLAQDEASSVVWGMPGAVVQHGLADRVVPLPQMAEEITSMVRALNHRSSRRGA